MQASNHKLMTLMFGHVKVPGLTKLTIKLFMWHAANRSNSRSLERGRSSCRLGLLPTAPSWFLPFLKSLSQHLFSILDSQAIPSPRVVSRSQRDLGLLCQSQAASLTTGRNS